MDGDGDVDVDVDGDGGVRGYQFFDFYLAMDWRFDDGDDNEVKWLISTVDDDDDTTRKKGWGNI